MSHILTIPFYGFKLRFTSGGSISSPMMYADNVFPEKTISQMAANFRSVFQDKVIDKGNYPLILDQYTKGDFFHNTVDVAFPAAKNNYSYPDFELSFKYFFKTSESGNWVIVPVLGIEVFIDNDTDFDKTIVDTIKLEFMRKGRLRNVQNIVETIWFDSIELQQQEVNFKFHTPSELEKLSEEKKQEILPMVAKQIDLKEQVLYGMEGEMEQLIRSQKGKYGKNVLLVGPSGVGKTTLVWELARNRRKHKITANFWETTASTLIKELTNDFGWQENVAYLCKDLKTKGDVLFVRNLMELFEVGQYEGNSTSMAEYLRPYLSSGEIILMSECTDEELAQIDLRSPNFSSLFNVIRVEEPKTGLEEIILKKVNSIAKGRKINIEEDAVRETVRLNRRYTPYSGFPGKPIRFLESIIINKKKEENGKIGKSEVISHFCEETGMPAFMVDPAIPMQPKKIKVDFKAEIFGQDHGVDSVVDVFASVKTALTRQGKPISSFLFVGPTGVGKTEMAKIMANFMFGGRDKIIRFDMSEFSDAYSVLRLTGAGHGTEGLLTSAVRRDPFAVILFDEIEKADASFYDLLLQVLGEGRLTDARGKLVNFCSTIIVMTSNIGAASLQNNNISWTKNTDTKVVDNHFLTAVEKHFRPELFNRIDRVIPFSPLGRDTMRFVVEREISLFKQREGIAFRPISINIDEDVLEYISDVGYDEKYGARHLQRALREQLVTPLSKELNRYQYDEQIEVNVFLEANDDGNKKILLEIKQDSLQFELLLEKLKRDADAKISSDYRRLVYQVIEGNAYVRLLNELDMLETKKKKKGEKFWKNEKDSEKYSHFIHVKEKMAALTKRVEQIEMELSLNVMELQPYRSNIGDELKTWNADFEGIKIEMLSRINREYNQCHIAIMGMEPKRLFEFYQSLLKHRGLEIEEARTLWFRESYYNETILRKTTVERDGKKEIKEEKVSRMDYVHRVLDPNDEHCYRPDRPDDICVGITISIKSPAIYLYFEPEQGRTDWNMDNKEKYPYFIKVTHREIAYPRDVHRKDFFNKHFKRSRRVITPNSLKDSTFKIDRNVNRSRHQEFISNHLDMLFRKMLDEKILGI